MIKSYQRKRTTNYLTFWGVVIVIKTTENVVQRLACICSDLFKVIFLETSSKEIYNRKLTSCESSSIADVIVLKNEISLKFPLVEIASRRRDVYVALFGVFCVRSWNIFDDVDLNSAACFPPIKVSIKYSNNFVAEIFQQKIYWDSECWYNSCERYTWPR